MHRRQESVTSRMECESRVKRAHHGAIGDEADEGVGREEAERDDDALLEGLEVVVLEARVDDKEEDGRDLGGARQGVLDRGVLWQELGGQVRGRDVLVVRGEGVALEAEGADPQLAADVDLAVRVEDGAAGGLAGDGFVQDRGQVGPLLEGRVELCARGWGVGICQSRCARLGRSRSKEGGNSRRTAPMGTTVRVASMRLPAQTFHESLTPSRSSTSSKSNAR